MGKSAEEEGTGGLEAPPPPVRAGLDAAGAAGAERRERLGVDAARAAVELARLAPDAAGTGVVVVRLSLLVPAAGSAAGAAWAGAGGSWAWAAGSGAGVAAGVTTVAVTGTTGVSGGAVEAGPWEVSLGTPLAEGAEAAGAELAGGLALLRVREVRLAIAQVGREGRKEAEA